MSHRARGELTVTRSFEPGHLSPTWLAAAYERMVAQRVRQVRGQTEREKEDHEKLLAYKEVKVG